MHILSDCDHEARVHALLHGFERSRERAYLGRRRVRFVRAFLTMVHDMVGDIDDPSTFVEDFAREIIPHLPRWCGGSAVEGDAERMLTELRTFWRYAARTGALPFAPGWLHVLERGDFVEALRAGIARERRRAERRRHRRRRLRR